MPEISCDPADLAQASACYCFAEGQQSAVMIYLLEQIAQTGLTPAQMAQAAACYCFPPKEQQAVIVMLLCEIANA